MNVKNGLYHILTPFTLSMLNLLMIQVSMIL